MTAPAFGPALVTLGWFLAGPLTALAANEIHRRWRNHHPTRTDTEETP